MPPRRRNNPAGNSRNERDLRDIEMDELRRQVQQLEQRLEQHIPFEREGRHGPEGEQNDDEDDNPFHHENDSNVGSQRRVNANQNRGFQQNFHARVDIPEFEGRMQPEEFVDWLHTVERIFEYHEVPEDRMVKLVAIKLTKYASLWWENLRKQRARDGKSRILTWEKMKKNLKRKFLPDNYRQDNFLSFHNFRQKEKNVEEFTAEFERLMMRLINLLAKNYANGRPHRILVDTDVDTDDVFALLYILKLDTSIFDLQAVTINANAWTNPGHSVNEVYDLLFMMGRDDVSVGVGGEGRILQDGTILPDVGGYLPIIEQGHSTTGYCRYSQVIPLGAQGKLDADTKFGYRKSFLPKGYRKYQPEIQPTAQQVMIDTIYEGPTTVFILGAHTNLAIFLMSNPELKENIQHIYIMGGAVRTTGNIYTGYPSSPYAEYNIFSDPFAAYQVIHSGIPVTLVPLDATNTIPITARFLEEFEKNQRTYESQYCFKILKMIHDTWSDDQFFSIFYMWDSFLAGVATSIMVKENNRNGENEFAEMEYMNITVVTSNEPYGISDGSNPIFDGIKTPKFGLRRDDVHSGHVYTRPTDSFCIARNGCKDGYTKEVSSPQGVHVRVAVAAKQSLDKNRSLDKQFYISFLQVLNQPQQTGRFNLTTQLPHYREVLYKPDFEGKQLGKNVVFDMDMSAGDFLALLYILKVPVEVINLKAILVTPTGWANAATIDVIYDLLHMMGRDDIPVGLGDYFALEQSYPNFTEIGACKYNRAIPHGSGGFLDSDTLYGLHRNLPRGSRRYTAENSVSYGAPRTTAHPELRQPRALDVWHSVINSLGSKSKVTILANGPLTTVAQIILSDKNSTFPIQEVIIVGGHISKHKHDTGNVMNIPANKYSEINMFLDPLAAKTVFESSYNLTLIPLNVQRKVSHFYELLGSLYFTYRQTPELMFAERLLSRLFWLKETNYRYENVDTFSGEILGAVILGGDSLRLKTQYATTKISVLASGDEAEDGRLIVDRYKGRVVRVLENLDSQAYYTALANQLAAANQSAVVGINHDF